MLKLLDRMESRRAAKAGKLGRKTVGLYVGWRGALNPVPGMRAVTFWNRKRTAHEVGRGALSEILLRVEQLVNETKRSGITNRLPSRLVVIGHSFGGAATYSALAPIFMERLLEPPAVESHKPAATGFGDLVMLINPAFEAARYGVLRDAALAEWNRTNRRDDGGPGSRLNLVILTSRSDAATGTAFPIGRVVPGLLQAHQNRTQYWANITAVGHYQPFITHTLLPTPKLTNWSQLAMADAQPDLTETNATATRKPPRGFAEQSKTTEDDENQIGSDSATVDEILRKQNTDAKARKKPLRMTYTKLTTRTNMSEEPFMVVAVDKKIIPDHSRIHKPILLGFLVDYLGYLAATNVQTGTAVAPKPEGQ